MNIRQRRLLFTVCGLALAVLGAVFWLKGDEDAVTGSSRMDLHSSAGWGEVLGFESDERVEYDDARSLKDRGESEKSTGLVFVGLGAVAFFLRFTARTSATKGS
ncbi:hypothetical protein [Streptomyces griseoaurantiacus]|uniref:hypothetical protein n=1 Tax=Streptomyces griseoaurantiacus TaxID=68213 RepID=UPI0036C39F29